MHGTGGSAAVLRAALDHLGAVACGGGALVEMDEQPNRVYRWGVVVILEPKVRTSARKAHWLSPARHLLTTALVLLCPPAMHSRRLMWFWYRRPGERE